MNALHKNEEAVEFELTSISVSVRVSRIELKLFWRRPRFRASKVIKVIILFSMSYSIERVRNLVKL